MPLNKQKGNMYGFVTHTWNTIKGKCPHNCVYCYMKKFGDQPKLHFDERELKTDLGSGNFIFVGSSCDMWAKDIDVDWILRTLELCRWFPDNQYLFQTKNPARFHSISPDFFPKNTTLCITIETNRYNKKQKFSKADNPTLRTNYFNNLLLYNKQFKPMVTIEPIIDFDLGSLLELINSIKPVQINIGANTNYKVKLPEPSPEKVYQLIMELEQAGLKVHVKKNLNRILAKLDFANFNFDFKKYAENNLLKG